MASSEPQNTLFTLDRLGRQVCNTWSEATKDSEGIDVVVIGSGMYGGFCASKIFELSYRDFNEKPLRVLVLEAGPFLVPEHSQNIPDLGLDIPGRNEKVNSGDDVETVSDVWGIGWRSNQFYAYQAYCVGGKGVFWGGWCPRLQADDLKLWPQEVVDYLTKDEVGKRPVTHKDFYADLVLEQGEKLNGYEVMEYEIGAAPTDDFVFDPTNNAEKNPDGRGLNLTLRFALDEFKKGKGVEVTGVLAAPAAVQTQSFVSGLFSLDKYSSVPALIAAKRKLAKKKKENEFSTQFTLVPNAHVVRLITAQDKDEAPDVGTRRVSSLVARVKNENGKYSEETLKLGPQTQVVLAMSCIETTRLALESFSLEGSLLVKPGEELMGRNLMVHLRQDIHFDVPKAKLQELVRKMWPGKTLEVDLQLSSLHVQCQTEIGGEVYQYQYQLFAATNGDPDNSMYRLIPDLQAQETLIKTLSQESVHIVLRASGEVKGGRKVKLSESQFDFISLDQNDFDGVNGHRRAYVKFQSLDNKGEAHGADKVWDNIKNTAQAIADYLNGVEEGKPKTVVDFHSHDGAGTCYHEAGTLWMGNDHRSSVTDINGHFHHMTNVYCSDQALFPTVGSANPVLTGLCLTQRVADNIVSRHGYYEGGLKRSESWTTTSFNPSRGWKTAPYNGMQYIPNGEILETFPQSEGIGLYYLPETLTDFDLYVEWKAYRTPENPNSGILLRMPDPALFDLRNPSANNPNSSFDAFYEQVVEIQIDDLGKNFKAGGHGDLPNSPKSVYGDSLYKTGAIYGVAPARLWAGTVQAPDGGDTAERYWNAYEIKCRDNKVTVILNGQLVVCEAQLPNEKTGDKANYLGFQFHTGRVQFRNLRLSKNV